MGGNRLKEYTVKEVSSLLGKHEETIKRWIRSGKLPNSHRNSDKEGWRIPEEDLKYLEKNVKSKLSEEKCETNNNENEERDLVKLAYEAVTLTSPSEEILTILTVVGIKRTLEILLIMQQSVSKVKNPDGFIKKAIRENWSPSTVPVKKPKHKKIYELSQQDYDNLKMKQDNEHTGTVPFYNWLED